MYNIASIIQHSICSDVCAVENFAFCGAKTYLEYLGAHRFVSDHVQWTAARVLASLPKFAQMVDRMGLEEALGAHTDSRVPEYRALSDAPDSSVARLRFLNALARRHLMNVHREMLNFGRCKSFSLEDPVFAAASASEEELRAFRRGQQRDARPLLRRAPGAARPRAARQPALR
jgi:hypothetical protein